MGALVPFAYGDVLVRVVELSGDPWWVAGDVAKVLGYPDAYKMVRLLDDDEQLPHIVGGLEGGRQVEREMTIISESGLYHAIFKSRRAEAKHFRKWVTSEVLPAIRKDGFYSSTAQTMDPWEALSRRLEQVESLILHQDRLAEEKAVRAITYTPEVFRLERLDGRIRKQRYPKWWGDLPVRQAVIALHRQMTISKAVAELTIEFGSERSPSRSALARHWKQLDQLRGVKRKLH